MLLIHSHLILFANQTIMTKNQNIKCKQIQLHSIEWPANQIKCSANNVRSTLLFDRHTYSYHIYIYTYIYGYMQWRWANCNAADIITDVAVALPMFISVLLFSVFSLLLNGLNVFHSLNRYRCFLVVLFVLFR